MKTLLNRKNSDGFTLIEMVVAVGVLLALSVGGFLAYSGHQHRAKVAVTEAAAQEVYNGGRLAQEQGQAATTARDEFNATTDAITTDIEEKSDRTICATAVHHDDNEITASRGNCSGESGNEITPPDNSHQYKEIVLTCKTTGGILGTATDAVVSWNQQDLPNGAKYVLKLDFINDKRAIAAGAHSIGMGSVSMPTEKDGIKNVYVAIEENGKEVVKSNEIAFSYKVETLTLNTLKCA